MTPLLEVRQVTKTFGGGWFDRRKTVALDGFSMVVDGEHPSITALVGESGSGKTTLARLILGLARPTEGQILYQGKDLLKLGRRERRQFRRDVQVIFQDPFEVYNPFYKVDHSLTLPIRKFHLANSRQEARALLEETVRSVGLHPEDTLGRYPHQLSGGQRQRIMVARALLIRPKMIVADEPVSMIDASLRATVLENLQKLNQEFGISILYITHDLTTAYEISENIIVLYQGSVAEVGDIELVVQDPKHPYTQLLIESIPQPDPERKWGGKSVSRTASEDGAYIGGCKFADRCPVVMDICRQQVPPLFKVDEHRAAACFVYRDSQVMEDASVNSIFPELEAAARATA